MFLRYVVFLAILTVGFDSALAEEATPSESNPNKQISESIEANHNNCVYSFRMRCRFSCQSFPGHEGANGSTVFCVSCGKLCSGIPQSGGVESGLGEFTSASNQSDDQPNLTLDVLVPRRILGQLAEQQAQQILFVARLGDYGFSLTAPSYGEVLATSAHVISPRAFQQISAELSSSSGLSSRKTSETIEKSIVDSSTNLMPSEVVLHRATATIFNDGNAEIRIISDLHEESTENLIGEVGDELILRLSRSEGSESNRARDVYIVESLELKQR